MKKTMAKKIKVGLVTLCALFAAIQLVPYGRGQSNPATVKEPQWDAAQTRELAKRACFDCHSNETVKPWYSTVAPVSWLIWRDIQAGRRALNFSEWQGSGQGGESPTEIANEISEGEMPPFQYRLFHPASRLTEAEKKQLAEGLTATVLQSGRMAKQ